MLIFMGLGIATSIPAPSDNGIIKTAYPGGEAIGPAPDFSQWQVNFTFSQTKGKPGQGQAKEEIIVGVAPPPPQPKSLSVIKTKPMKRIVLIYADGSNQSAWNDGQETYWMTNDNHPYTMPRDMQIQMSPFLTFGDNDFPGMEWVSEQNYVGMQEMRGSKCLVFEVGGITAWVNESNRLPMRWASSYEIRDYVFQESPKAELTMPDQVQQLIKQEKQVRENNNRRAR
jgi:hypothetical protein